MLLPGHERFSPNSYLIPAYFLFGLLPSAIS